MAVKYYKSATDAGGAMGAQLSDGGIDDLLPPITSQNRLQGTDFFRKIWYESDADIGISCYLYFIRITYLVPVISFTARYYG